MSRNNFAWTTSCMRIATFAAMSIFFFGCGGDEPPAPKVSLIGSSVEMLENSPFSIVASFGPALSLDRAAPENVTVYIEASGGDATVDGDYKFISPVVIPKGELRASVGLQFIDDKLDERDERGVIKISRTEGSPVSIDTTSAYFVVLDDDEADLNISLAWGIGGNTGSDKPDLDLYLWHETSPGTGIYEIVKSSANHNYPSGSEAVVLSGLEKDGRYGISCVYYEPATGDFQFRLILQPVGSGILEGGTSSKVIEPIYKGANVNKGTVTVREIYFTKQGSQYNNVSPFITSGSGS